MTKKTKEKKAVETLFRVSKKVGSSLELKKVSDMILEEARSFLETDYSSLFLLDEKSGNLMLIGASGFRNDQLENLKVLGSWERINLELIKKLRPIIVNDITRNTLFKNKEVPFLHEKLPLGAFLAVPLKTKSKVIGVLVVSNHKKNKTKFTTEDKNLLYTLANEVSIALLNARLYETTKNLFLNTIASLITAVDAKDPYTHGHSERVAKYAVAIGEEMKLSPDFLKELRLSGLLHDMGKIGISDSILSKTEILSDEEMEKVKEHPAIGLRIVDSVIHSKCILGGISAHHERFNGEGYPKKLKGEEIPLSGRIVAVADAFDTLTTNRPYQKALSTKEASLEVIRSVNTQFDPNVVKAFQRSFSKRPDFWNFK